MTSYNPESRFRSYMNFARLMALARKDWTFGPRDLVGIIRADSEKSEFTGADIRNFWKEYALELKRNRQEHVIELVTTMLYCPGQCNFCLSHMETLRDDSQLEAYAKLLMREMLYFSEVFNGVSFSKVYFDGGTPTMFSENQLERIGRTLFKNFHFRDDVFSNVDAHPHCISRGKLQVLKNCGFNNICFGVQSTDPDVLRINNRTNQTRRMVSDAVRWAREAGMGISIELMLGLVGDDEESFLRSVKEITELQPELVVIYLLEPSAYYLAKYFNNSPEEFRSHIASRMPWLEKAVALAGSCGFEVLPHSFDSAWGGCHIRVGFGRPGGDRMIWHWDWEDSFVHSTLGLGRQWSCIYPKLRYEPVSISEDPAQSRYRGWKYSLKDEQQTYLFSRFEMGIRISKEKFEKWYGVSVENTFGDALASLRALGLMDEDATGFRLLPQIGSVELFAASMFFLDFGKLAQMVKRMAEGLKKGGQLKVVSSK